MAIPSDDDFEFVVDNIGLEQLMFDANLTEMEVALHLHHCGLIDLETYLDDPINTKEY